MKNPKTRRRIARLDVVCWAIAFVSLQIGMALALDYDLSIIRNPNVQTRERLLRAIVEKEPQRPLVVVLGSSHSLHGLRPDILNNAGTDQARPVVFNFSQPGFGPTHNYVTLKHLLADGFRPDAVVLEMVPFQLVYDLSRQDYIASLNWTLGDVGEYVKLRDRPRDVYRQWIESRAMPAFSFRFQLMERVLPKWLPPNKTLTGWRDIDPNGWLPLYWNSPNPSALEKARVSFEDLSRNFKVAPTSRKAIQMIVELCREEKISLTVLFAPEGRACRSWYTPQATNGTLQLIDWLRHEQHIAVVDAREWIDDEALFWDSHHLVPKGAAVFTERFSRDLMPRFAHLRVGPVAAKSK